jgi:hypothetical protein
MSTEQQVDTVVTLTPSALDAHREAIALISDARQWAEMLLGYDWSAQTDEGAAMREQETRRELVREMERSYHTNFLHLITMAQGFDGGLKFWRDTQACMFWRHEKSGYCGGLIFHRDHRYSDVGDPLTVGTWSVHT